MPVLNVDDAVKAIRALDRSDAAKGEDHCDKCFDMS